MLVTWKPSNHLVKRRELMTIKNNDIVSEFDTKSKRLTKKQKLQNALEHLEDAQEYFRDNLDSVL